MLQDMPAWGRVKGESVGSEPGSVQLGRVKDRTCQGEGSWSTQPGQATHSGNSFKVNGFPPLLFLPTLV